MQDGAPSMHAASAQRAFGWSRWSGWSRATLSCEDPEELIVAPLFLLAAALAAYMVLGRRGAELRQGRQAAASRHWGGSSGRSIAPKPDMDLHLGYLLNPASGHLKHFAMPPPGSAAEGATAPRNGSSNSTDVLLGSADRSAAAAAAPVRLTSACRHACEWPAGVANLGQEQEGFLS